MGSSLGSPLPGIWNCLLHSGHVILPWTPLFRWIPFRQWRQKLWKRGNCFGSVNAHMHTEQDTSSWRLSSKVFISMEKVGNKVTFQKFRASCWRSREWLCEWTMKYCLVTQTNNSVLLTNQIEFLDMFWWFDGRIKSVLWSRNKWPACGNGFCARWSRKSEREQKRGMKELSLSFGNVC